MSNNTNESPTWDLTPLYAGVDDPAISADLQTAQQLANTFRSDYHGRIAADDLTAQQLLEALQSYAILQQTMLRPYLFAQLLFSSDSGQTAHARLLAKVREAWQQVSETTLFFELELLRIAPEHFVVLQEDSALAEYRHYLVTTRAHAPYTLSETVEQALKRKDLSGKDAFVQLFDELTSGLTFHFRFPEEEEERDCTGEELLALLYHPDSSVREQAFATFLGQYGEQALVLTSVFNNILLDHGKEAELRRYPDLMTPTHLSSETDPEMIEQMLQVTEQHYPLVQEYFSLKRQLLGLDRLKNTDLYAPVKTQSRQYRFEDAWQIVHTALQAFDPQLAEMIDLLRDQARLDVPPRPGKTGGAFCMGLYPGADPYVLLNFTGTLRDVTTLAHELGHALHYMLAGEQNLFHYHAPLPLAETASVFGEMLVTRHLLDHETDRQVKIALLCAKLEEIIATTFRQAVLTRFEQQAHARRGQELLSTDDLCDLWLAENARLFGDAVEMIPAYRWGWSYISHFIHARFYCYSYVFGELLVLALYQKYRKEGAAFIPAYLDVLKAGGSVRPADLVRPLGIDLKDPEFWAQGYALVRGMLDELKELTGLRTED